MTTRLNITEVLSIGNLVTSAHFGANVVYTRNNDPDGSPDQPFWDAVNGLGAVNIRYPGGSVSEHDIDIAKMPGGKLDPRLVAFFDELGGEQHMIDGQPRQTNLVIRTREVVGETKEEWAANVAIFAEEVMRKYGHLIASFQLGNEYWGSGGYNEIEYGHRANVGAIALQQGIDAANTAYDPSIVVQMANPSTVGSMFNRAATTTILETPPELLTYIEREFLEAASMRRSITIDELAADRLWFDRVDFANLAILQQLSPGAVDAIDAVVEHYYVNDPIQDDQINFGERFGNYSSAYTSNIDRKYLIWSQELYKEFDLFVTEWGVFMRNEAQHGIKGTAVLMEQFEYMLKMGVDAAYVWPVNHNVDTALAGRLGEQVLIDSMGTVYNSPMSAAFDLMSSNLIGLHQLDIAHENPDAPVEVNAYGSDDKLIVYISSRSSQNEGVSFNTTHLGAPYTSVRGVQIGYGETYAPGTTPADIYPDWISGEIDHITVDGEVLFLTDDRMTAATTYFQESTLTQGVGAVTLELRPFEVVELTYHLNTGVHLTRGAEHDEVLGSHLNDILIGGAGDDTLRPGDGADRVMGGDGFDIADYSNANNGLVVNLAWALANSFEAEGDVHFSIEGIIGGRLDDYLHGNDADNHLEGGAGNDTLVGLGGDDSLIGDRGDDLLIGHRGDDVLEGGAGNDTLFGDPGMDRLIGGLGNDLLTGGRDADVFVFRRGDGADVITDFDLRHDRLELAGITPDLVQLRNINHGEAIRLEFGLNDSITLQGVSLEGFDMSTLIDFL